MRVISKVHKCVSLNLRESTCHYCAYCGILMSGSRNGPAYYRSHRYRIIDLYRMDNNTMLLEMIKKQHVNRFYNPKARYTKYRTELLEMVKFAAEKLDYSNCTYFLSIGLLDAIMSQHVVERDQLKLVCFLAVHMAAKMEEKQERVSGLVETIKLLGNEFDKNEVKNCELTLAKLLGFKLDLKTPHAFIEYFLSKGIVNEFDVGTVDEEQRDEFLLKFERKLLDFIDISAFNYEFNKYSPVVVAAATIACARRNLGFANYWSSDLQGLTEQSYDDIKYCARKLYRYFEGSDCSAETVGSKTTSETPKDLDLAKYDSSERSVISVGTSDNFKGAKTCALDVGSVTARKRSKHMLVQKMVFKGMNYSCLKRSSSSYR